MRDGHTVRAIAREAYGLSGRLTEVLAIMETLLRRPVKLTSGLRPGDSGSHGGGDAADIAVASSSERFEVVQAALAAGVCRIGVYDRHVHVDVCDVRPQAVLWLGLSR